MKWYKNQNGEITKPSELDQTSSKKYIYIRKDFVLIEESEDTPAHWQWMEKKIPREEWEMYSKLISHDEDIQSIRLDMEEAVTGLLEFVLGGE